MIRKLLSGIYAIVSLIILVQSSVYTGLAQDDELKPIYSGEIRLDESVRWTPNSTTLVFQDFSLGLEKDAENWIQYDSLKKELTKTKTPITLFVFTDEQRNALKVDPAVDLGFASPNQKYVVYVTESNAEWASANWGYSLTLADLSTNDLVQLNLPVESAFYVNWNTNSTAFTVETTTNYAAEIVYYVGNIDSSLSFSVAQNITYDQIVDGETWTIYDAYAISPDGTKVLAGNGSSLLLLDLINPASNILISSDVVRRAATFNSEGDKVIYLSQEGLFSVDLAGKQKEQLNLEPKAAILRPAFAVISPSSKEIVLFMFTETGEQAVYVVEVN